MISPKHKASSNSHAKQFSVQSVEDAYIFISDD